MEPAVGREADAVAFLAEALADEPYRYDFYQTLRRLECLYAATSRAGAAPCGPSTSRSASARIRSCRSRPRPSRRSRPARGRSPAAGAAASGSSVPNGPLPMHLTEYARERLHHAGDPTLRRFLDIFHHRFLALFYRAWAQAQPHVNLDRPEDDRFCGLRRGVRRPAVAARCGTATRCRTSRSCFTSARLVAQVRNAEGLGTRCTTSSGCRWQIEEFVGHWMALGPRERTYLGRDGATPGRRRGPRPDRCGTGSTSSGSGSGRCTLEAVRALPARAADAADGKLVGLGARTVLCSFELDWDVRLLLAAGEVPAPAARRGRAAGLDDLARAPRR